MESYKIEHLTFTYPDADTPVLDDVCFCVEQGQFVTLCGKSGCGKTTLLRQLKPCLTPNGIRYGKIFFWGTPLENIDQREQAEKIGFVLQSPENQLVTDKVWHELAFGLESLGVKNSEIRARVSEMASFFGIQTWFHKKGSELSGGQKQLLNLASVMVMQPSVLILDEPTGQLDPIAAQDFLETILRINREFGTTVILTEHRLEDAFPISDRVIVMDSGRIIADGTPAEVGELLKNTDNDMFMALPAPMRIYAAVKNDLKCPVTVREGRNWLDEFGRTATIDETLIHHNTAVVSEEVAVELKDIWFRYEKQSPDVVKGLSVKIHKGELYAVTGGNGTGKTTALGIISGLYSPYRGKVLLFGEGRRKIDGLIGVLPQNPQTLFVKKTVELDLYEMLSDGGLTAEEKSERINKVCWLCELESILSRHPYDLSGGEQQRAALAKVLLARPKILLLDEPTKGLDAHFKKKLAGVLKDLKSIGVTVIMVSHDIEFCAEYADRCAMFFDGAVVSEDAPTEFFSGKSFYTTAANRMARAKLPTAVLAEDVIIACGGKVRTDIKEKPIPNEEHERNYPTEKPQTINTGTERPKMSKRTVVSIITALAAVPVTAYMGMAFFDDRKYYFISLLIILEALIPFALVFEGRKPQARELVVISVLCAIAVAGRTVFFMFPQFKPVAAIVIISGVCFGGETGFLVGAVTAFVSNMFFGQGPWTPWQMLALGIIGLLAGVLFCKRLLPTDRKVLCVFGFLSVFLIYGGIMNPAAVLMWQSRPKAAMFTLAYLKGIPFDLVHAASTLLLLWFIAVPMIEKIDRIKVKYGLIAKSD